MVYILQMSDTTFYKIGFTSRNDVAKRLAELQTACPRRLVLIAVFPGDESVESDWHRRYWQYKTDGGEEWFDIPNFQGDLTEYDKPEAKYQRAVGGASPFDVRQIRRGQCDPTANGRADVSNPGYGASNARPKYPVLVGRREYEVSVSPVLRAAGQDDSTGNQQLHDD